MSDTTETPVVVYEIEDKEHEILVKMRDQLTAAQNNFFSLVRFIAEREGVNLDHVTFDQAKLVFSNRASEALDDPEPIKE